MMVTLMNDDNDDIDDDDDDDEYEHDPDIWLKNEKDIFR